MARADAQHTANVREPARLTLGALKGVEHPASATGVDYGTYTTLGVRANCDALVCLLGVHRTSPQGSAWTPVRAVRGVPASCATYGRTMPPAVPAVRGPCACTNQPI